MLLDVPIVVPLRDSFGYVWLSMTDLQECPVTSRDLALVPDKRQVGLSLLDAS